MAQKIRNLLQKIRPSKMATKVTTVRELQEQEDPWVIAARSVCGTRHRSVFLSGEKG